MTEPPLPLRRAVRALMIDHSDRVLMVKLHIEHSGWTGWVLPGGGIEEGEDTETALRRELLEETGLADPFIGPVVCSRTQRGPSVALGYGGQQDEIRLVPCHDFPLAPALEKTICGVRALSTCVGSRRPKSMLQMKRSCRKALPAWSTESSSSADRWIHSSSTSPRARPTRREISRNASFSTRR